MSVHRLFLKNAFPLSPQRLGENLRAGQTARGSRRGRRRHNGEGQNVLRCDALCSTLRWTMQCAAKADAPHCVGCFIQAQLQAGNAVVWHGARRAVCRSRHSLGQGRFRFLRPMPKPRARGVPDSRSGHPLPPVRSPLRRHGRWIGVGRSRHRASRRSRPR